KIAGQDVARLQVHQLAHGDLGAAQHGGELHVGVLDLFLQRAHPALVVLDTVAGDAGIEQLAQRFDHGVRHGDVNVAAAAIELHVKAGDHHDFRRADDVGEVRIDLGVQI